MLVHVFLQGRLVYYTFCDRWRGKRGYRYADCGECLWAKIVIIIAILASIVATILVILWIVVVGVAITTTF